MSKNQIYGLVAVVVLALGGGGSYYFMTPQKECCKKEATCNAMTDSSATVSDSAKTEEPTK
jgi:hypothetical protein